MEAPEILPERLPKGTKTKHGTEAKSEVYLRGGTYEGRWLTTDGRFTERMLAAQIDWSTVTEPEEDPAKLGFPKGTRVSHIVRKRRPDFGRHEGVVTGVAPNGTSLMVRFDGEEGAMPALQAYLTKLDDGFPKDLPEHPIFKTGTPVIDMMRGRLAGLAGVVVGPTGEPGIVRVRLEGRHAPELCSVAYLKKLTNADSENAELQILSFGENLAEKSRKPDPYAKVREFDNSPRGLALIAKQRLADDARRTEQALAALARPLQRFGAMKNRDKYGQKLELRGWETDHDTV